MQLCQLLHPLNLTRAAKDQGDDGLDGGKAQLWPFIRRTDMAYRDLGRTGLKVSRMCLDCMNSGISGRLHDWTLDEEASRPGPCSARLWGGINFFDMANGYWVGTLGGDHRTPPKDFAWKLWRRCRRTAACRARSLPSWRHPMCPIG